MKLKLKDIEVSTSSVNNYECSAIYELHKDEKLYKVTVYSSSSLVDNSINNGILIRLGSTTKWMEPYEKYLVTHSKFDKNSSETVSIKMRNLLVLIDHVVNNLDDVIKDL